MTTRTRKAPRAAGVALLATALMGVFAGTASALWITTGSGTGSVTTTTLNKPAAVSGNGTTRLVSWTQSNAGAVAPTSFLVERSSTTGARSWIPACTAAAGATSCTDTAATPATDTFVFRVTARYNASWTAVSNESSAVTYTVTPVTVGIPDLTSGSDSGTSQTDNLTNVTTPTFAVAASPGSTVQLYDNGIATGSSSLASGGSATVTSAPLTGGTGTVHTITAKATLSGNTATSDSLAVTVDTSAPTVDAITVTSNNTSGNAKGLSGTASTAAAHPGALSTVTATVSGVADAACTVSPTTATVNQTNGTWSGPSVSLNRGFTCTATVTLQDSAGNAGASTATVSRT